MILRMVLSLVLVAAPGLAQAQQSDRLHKLLTDWAGLNHYGSDDTEIPKPKAGENRVVFLGDQMTEQWADPANGGFFTGKLYIDRGIADQTSGQMLVRFRQDVIELDPKVVIIQVGTNDIASFTGPSPEGVILENLASMTELAKFHGIRVIIASVLPVCDCFGVRTKLRPQGKIASLNGAIKRYVADNGLTYLDYYSALAEGRNFKQELTSDGLLPNAAGYALMAPLAEKAIAQALASPMPDKE